MAIGVKCFSRIGRPESFDVDGYSFKRQTKFGCLGRDRGNDIGSGRSNAELAAATGYVQKRLAQLVVKPDMRTTDCPVIHPIFARIRRPVVELARVEPE